MSDISQATIWERGQTGQAVAGYVLDTLGDAGAASYNGSYVVSPAAIGLEFYRFNMPEELAAVQLEYRRRRNQISKIAGAFILLPVGLLGAVKQLAAPPILTKVFAAATMLGVVEFGVFIFRVSRCPNCRFPVWLGQATLN